MLTRQQVGLPVASSIQSLAEMIQEHKRLVEAIQGLWDTLNRDGALDIVQARITASHGIIFPATQNASSDVNTLDDYEEGNWTPTDTSGAGLTFTTPTGHYQKVGNTVRAWGNVTYPVTANASAARIGGLPFTVANTEAARAGGLVTYSDETTLAYVIVAKNATDMGLAASSGATVSNATMSGNAVYFLVVYPI